MEPETEKLIASYPELTTEEAKLVFIRKSAKEAYEKGEIEKATEDFFIEINKIATCASMSKEEIGTHLGNLEKVRDYLAAFTQGLAKGHAEEVEPKIKAKREREKKQKSVKTKDKKVNALIQMAINASDGIKATPKANTKVSKVTCEKCGKEVYSLKFHKCKESK